MHAVPQSFNWLYITPNVHPIPVEIRVESAPQESSFFPMSSTPATYSAPSMHLARSPSPFSLGSPDHPSIVNPKRVQFYRSLLREPRFQEEGAGNMVNSSYGAWPPPVIKGDYGKLNIPGERRGSHPDQQSSSTLSHAFGFHSFIGGSSDRSDHRLQSSNLNMTTSSLTGAMGDPHVAPQFKHSNSPSPVGEQAYDMNVQSGLHWVSNQTPCMAVDALQAPYSEVVGQRTYHTLSQPSGSMHSQAGSHPQYDYGSTYQNSSPESLSPPSTPYTKQLPFQQPLGVPAVFPQANAHYNASTPAPSPPPFVKEKLEHEIRLLRKKVRDLELINESAHVRISKLEGQLAVNRDLSSTPSGSSPSTLSTSLPQSAAFKASWKARTEARIRQFCSLNRAGNALCAWHDSRRERRTYPARMAPAGHLNCGCTFEEALFEESLARHSVGSYHPGETVRMDPALRNPLLKLLHSRYGYKDGDFERDRSSGEWVEGEGPAYWESIAQAGSSSHRRSKVDHERR